MSSRRTQYWPVSPEILLGSQNIPMHCLYTGATLDLYLRCSEVKLINKRCYTSPLILVLDSWTWLEVREQMLLEPPHYASYKFNRDVFWMKQTVFQYLAEMFHVE
ncbi:hypothetical protein AVEN_154257-1 [Araneus ventricosus]|uniref:Uncharacterized protein n=1 Tax=Araneus ventricosus TaxID=182803 RepID=A0A4Y2IMD2_ARAVE|nr:hypothetical protein AVEN_154257-1 [Araneus ventricosus]